MNDSSPPPAASPTPEGTSGAGGGDPVADRRAKLAKLREQFHVDPFGHRIDGLPSVAEARARFDKSADDAAKADPAQDRRPIVRCAGRIVLHRDIGKLIFMTLRDATGDLQVGISKKSVDETAFNLAKLADLGDIVVAQGPLGTTKTGELTIWAGGAEAFTIASKSLAPPPEKWHGLTDPELRYRQRYVDLYANPHVAKTLQLRMRIVEEIRQFLRGRGYLEVETPMLQPMHGGAAARPFETHHNALDIDLYLRIAPELYLKRLLVGGFHKVFEINRNFRNEGISPRHNPEFTMLEAYEAFGSWETMADMVEEMICTVAQKVLGTLVIEHKDAEGKVVKTINLTRPWKRVRMDALVEERTGWKFDKDRIPASIFPQAIDAFELHRLHRHAQDAVIDSPKLAKRLQSITSLDDFFSHREGLMKMVNEALEDLRVRPEKVKDEEHELARIENQLKIIGLMKLDLWALADRQPIIEKEKTAFLYKLTKLSPAEQLVEVYEKLIEPTLIDPTFVTHVPSVAIPLAKENKDDPFFADVYELAINGQEISPGYTELNDPDVQERHFRHQVGDKAEQQQVDEDFLQALRVGMPPAGGIGLGIDRLVMMLTGAESIRDVILFPLMRPGKKS